MRTEVPTLDRTTGDFIGPPVVSDLSPLEVETLHTTNLINDVADRWLSEGDRMFGQGTSKIETYTYLRTLASNIPHYTNAIDVRDSDAIPNKQSLGLDTAFAKLHMLWRNDPDIKLQLEKEREEFVVRYREWYGTIDHPGKRDSFLQALVAEHKRLGLELGEREMEAREMKARRAYFLPTITTASESPV